MASELANGERADLEATTAQARLAPCLVTRPFNSPGLASPLSSTLGRHYPVSPAKEITSDMSSSWQPSRGGEVSSVAASYLNAHDAGGDHSEQALAESGVFA